MESTQNFVIHLLAQCLWLVVDFFLWNHIVSWKVKRSSDFLWFWKLLRLQIYCFSFQKIFKRGGISSHSYSVIGGEHGELTAVSPKKIPNEKVFPALQKNWFKIEYEASAVSRLTVPRDDSSMKLHNKKTRTKNEKLKLHTQLRKYWLPQRKLDIPVMPSNRLVQNRLPIFAP